MDISGNICKIALKNSVQVAKKKKSLVTTLIHSSNVTASFEHCPIISNHS